MTLSKLHKIASICLGKPLYYRPKPCTASEFQLVEMANEWANHNISRYVLHSITNLTLKSIKSKIEGLRLRKNKHAFKVPAFNIMVTPSLGYYNKFVPLAKIMNQHWDLLPCRLSYFFSPVIIYKNKPNTSAKLFNHRAATELFREKAMDIDAPCVCMKIPDAYCKDGHINTGNLDIILHMPLTANAYHRQKLIGLMKLGTKYVEKSYISKRNILISHATAINAYVQKLLAYTKMASTSDFDAWKEAVLEDINTVLETTPIPHQQDEELLTQKNIQSLIKELHHVAVITCIDKMPNNYSITCKRHWLRSLHKITLGTNLKAYRIIKKSEKEIIDRHVKYLHKNNFKAHHKLPIKYIITKQHKDGWRLLSATPEVTTTFLSIVLTVALAAIIVALHRDAMKFKMLTGINCWYDIDNASDVRNLIHDLNNDPKHHPSTLETADITGWYDNVQHYDLINKLKATIFEVFSIINRRKFLVIKGKSAIWTNKRQESNYYSHCFSAKELLKLLVWHIRNQYIKIGPVIVKQILGAGQGDNHSGHLCRLLSIIYERRFAKYWTTHDITVAKLFENTIRKYDDYAFFNNIHSADYLHKNKKTGAPGLMPAYFTLKYTTQQPQSSHYLDTTIHVVKNPYMFRHSYATELASCKWDEL